MKHQDDRTGSKKKSNGSGKSVERNEALTELELERLESLLDEGDFDDDSRVSVVIENKLSRSLHPPYNDRQKKIAVIVAGVVLGVVGALKALGWWPF